MATYTFDPLPTSIISIRAAKLVKSLTKTPDTDLFFRIGELSEYNSERAKQAGELSFLIGELTKIRSEF